MDQDKYQAAGIDFARGLERFMGNTELYKKFLTKFLYDGSFAEFCVGIEMGDMSMAENAVHTLKGTAGNLSLTRLFSAADDMVHALREGKSGEDVTDLVQKVNKAYQAACDAIREQA